MKIDTSTFQLPLGETVNLKKWPTDVTLFYKSKEHYKELLDAQIKALSTQQNLLYASSQFSLLLVIQGMDAAGKDGLIKHVMSGVNPQGCQVFSFKEPSAEELRHDFLWRTICRLPERGRFGIFNRSYYEDVLIVRVHPEMLSRQGLSQELLDEKKIWDERYRSIVDMETHLHRNGTRIIKIFLHLSKEEQKNRFLERIDNPEHNWKFSMADATERKLWDQYMHAYDKCLGATSTKTAPWFIVPADDKKNARLITSRIILNTLDQLKMKYPEVDRDRRTELKAIRDQL